MTLISLVAHDPASFLKNGGFFAVFYACAHENHCFNRLK